MLVLYFFAALLWVSALPSIGGLFGLGMVWYGCILDCGMVFVCLFCLLVSGLVGLCFGAGVVARCRCCEWCLFGLVYLLFLCLLALLIAVVRVLFTLVLGCSVLVCMLF